MVGSFLARGGAGIAALVALAILFRGWTSGAEAPSLAAVPDGTPSADRDRPSPHAPEGAPARAAEPRPASREATTVPETARLRLEIIHGNGSAVEGTVYWHSTANPPLTSVTLAPETGRPLPEDGAAGEKTHAGAATLDVPARSWTWLRATSTRQGRTLCAYARLAPFTGEQRLRLDLAEDSRRIHAFVLAPDLASGAAGEEVVLYKIDMRQSSSPEVVARKRADAHGYVCFDHLQPDGYLLCAAGASPKDRFPLVARIMLPPGMPPTEIPVTLVSAGSRATLRLEIETPPDLPGTPQARLFLRPTTALASQPIPVPWILSAGMQAVECSVAPGDYDLGVVPQGWLSCREGTGHVTVGEGGEHAVRLSRGSTTRMTLAGLPAEGLPVRVSLRGSGGVQASHSELLFCGPYQWRSSSEAVALSGEPCRVVAVGRTGAWTSSGDVPVGGATAEVAMVRGAQVYVRWRTRSAGSPAVLELSSGTFTSRVQLAREVVMHQGDPIVAWAAREVVPAGALELSCRAEAEGPTLWTARYQADKATVLVTVDESLGNRVHVEQR